VAEQAGTAPLILAIESSCDETAAAILRGERQILSSQVYSQIALHKPFGGVVPEIASRSHIEKIDMVVTSALQEAGLTCHIAGHIAANYLAHPDLHPPFLCLVVSGGHSHLVEVRDTGLTLLGCTRDDAAGEAFDKAARVLGLPYPGGPNLDRLAEGGNPLAYQLTLPRVSGPYDFSFSGLKTAFINLVHGMDQRGEPYRKADLAAVFRHTVVSHLCEKTLKACEDKGWRALALAGGVSANSLLRSRMAQLCDEAGIALYVPPLSLTGDNAAMIGAAATAMLARGEVAGLDTNAVPALALSYTPQD